MSELDVKKIRELSGKTQEEFAKLLGVSTRTIQNWERGGVIPQTKYEILKDFSFANVSGNNNLTNSVVHGNLDNRQYYSDSPDVLRAKIEDLEKMIAEKEERIKEKDAQIKEKDAQIKSLLDILKK